MLQGELVYKTFKDCVDAGNGVAGNVIPSFIGLWVVSDGAVLRGGWQLSQSSPDPAKPKNLETIIATVLKEKADIGLPLMGMRIVLGGDLSRGNYYPDRLMMLLSQDLLARVPGAKIVFDVKCSKNLASVIRPQGHSDYVEDGTFVVKAAYV